MKYVLVYLLKGKAKTYHTKLVKEVSRQFNTADLSSHIPAHLTIKSPFFTEDILEVESIIKKIAKDVKRSPFLLKGFGHFDKRVIFMDVSPSEEMIFLYTTILEALKQVPDMTFSTHEEKKINYHATIAYCDSEKIFNSIWNYLSFRKPQYELEFNAIAILKKPKDKWILHKEFTIPDKHKV